MNKFTVLLATLLLIAHGALADWAKFVHVTPDTRAEYRIEVCVSTSESKLNTVMVVVPLGELSEQDAWLITTGSYVGPKYQEFREFLWSDRRDDSPITSITKLEYLHKSFVLVEISEVKMSGSYIYVDYPTPVFDGGYYYSVDLGTFIGVDDGEC